MGNAESQPEEGEKNHGFHVLQIKEGSPADEAGLEPFFDYIIAINGQTLGLKPVDLLCHELTVNLDKQVDLQVYSSKLQSTRSVKLIPRTTTGAKSLIGCGIRWCSYKGAAENVWHVLDIYPNSPAHNAGLVPDLDYIIGTPDSQLRGKEDLYDLVYKYVGKPLRLYVYNFEQDKTRQVIIVPNDNWGGKGCLGCDIRYGYLHRIPIRVTNTVLGEDDDSILNTATKDVDEKPALEIPTAPIPTYAVDDTLQDVIPKEYKSRYPPGIFSQDYNSNAVETPADLVSEVEQRIETIALNQEKSEESLDENSLAIKNLKEKNQENFKIAKPEVSDVAVENLSTA